VKRRRATPHTFEQTLRAKARQASLQRIESMSFFYVYILHSESAPESF
jgi:hypothetical protein